MCGERKSEDEDIRVSEHIAHTLDYWLSHSLGELEVSEIGSTNSSAGLYVRSAAALQICPLGQELVFFNCIYIVPSIKQSNALQACSATDINENM